MKSFECYRGKKSAAKPQLPNEYREGKGPPCSRRRRSQRYAGAHYPAQPRGGGAPASIRKHPGNSRISRAKRERRRRQSRTTEGSGRTSGTSSTSATSITPTYGPAGCRPAGRRSEYGAGATTAGGGTQPYRQAALIRAASCPYEGGSRTNYGAAGDPPGAKKCRLRDRRLRYDG